MNQNIRNFAILAHIDHGKSTLADRFLELTQTVEKRKMRAQYLDMMDLEREKGITIKLQPVRMEYKLYSHSEPALAGEESPTNVGPHSREILRRYAPQDDNRVVILNLIDTPGHVDFAYEVSRSLAAVEGAILLVDATKGVQAQTLANLDLAQKQGLKIIPVINKIDLSNAQIEETQDEIKSILDENPPQPPFNKGGLGGIYKISAKEGRGVEELLRAIIKKIPSPQGNWKNPLQILIFDSHYDSYKGVVAYGRVKNGEIKAGDEIFLIGSGARAEVIEVGVFRPDLKPVEKLRAGEIGYIATGVKNISQCRVGDTITHFKTKNISSLLGYQEPKPMVFTSFYPTKEADFERLKEGLNKLKLNDASLVFELESSSLGRGFKCGFLGLLHLEIISERLKREFNVNLVITTPSLSYQLIDKSGQKKMIYAAQQMPDANFIGEIKELWVRLEIVLPNQYLGPVMNLLKATEGIYKNTKYLTQERLIIEYEAPLREIIIDFYDQLKGFSAGYASMSYEPLDWRSADLARLDILVAGEKVDALARIVPRLTIQAEGRAMVKKLKSAIPPQLFAVSLQAALGGQIVARENIRAMRKDVTGYLYGGDYSRKRKLLEKQKRGKKKMKAIGKINLPPEVFLAVLKK